MSYDLVLWSGEQATRKPGELWKALYLGAKHERETEPGAPATPDPFTSTLAYDEAKALVSPLRIERVLAAFRREFANDLEVDAETAQGTAAVRGLGFEFTLRDGAYYAHVCCTWELTRNEVALTRLRRAALRAHCCTYDVQTDVLFAPTEL